jgi:hypothetical protein
MTSPTQGGRDQTIKARNPARKKPPSSIDQSPVSNPRNRPSAVIRSAVERNIAVASMRFAQRRHKHAKCLLAVAGKQHRAITVILGDLVFPLFQELIECLNIHLQGVALPTHDGIVQPSHLALVCLYANTCSATSKVPSSRRPPRSIKSRSTKMKLNRKFDYPNVVTKKP